MPLTYAVGLLLILVLLQAVAIVVLVVRRRQRDRNQHDLRASEQQYRLITEQVPVMLWTARVDASLDYLNGNCMKYTGMSLEQMLDHGWLDAVHADDLANCERTLTWAMEARQPFLMEYRIRGADGVYRWVMDSIVPRYAPDGDFAGFIGCTIDINERRVAEDRIRDSRAALEVSHREIQRLAGRLIEAQDVERARVARDLHDDVSQQLAGLSIAFSGIRQQMAASKVDDSVQLTLQTLQLRTTAIAQSVRHLSHDLHPSVLQHAGLVAALASHCAELERLHGIALRFGAEGDFEVVTDESLLCLYRIAQEALRNVIKHASAASADVRLLRDGDMVELAITDDGKGFDVTNSLVQAAGLGLVSMAERVRLAGGELNIEAEASKGTRLRARIPAGAAVTGGAIADAERVRREFSHTASWSVR